MSFGVRLDEALERRGSLCVGIDPHASLLRAWGLADDVAGLERFALTCAEALAGDVAVVKPQSAFFERFGSAGVAVLERTIAACRAGGALVVLDVKRGDIGSTMGAYADAYLDPSAPLAADAITVSPYLGMGSLEPAFAAAAEHGAGVFVLALTSNAEGQQFQHALTSAGITVAQSVVDDLARRNLAAAGPLAGGIESLGAGSLGAGSLGAGSLGAGSLGAGSLGVGSLGVVVGATVTASAVDLSAFNGPYLVPGIGAQGGTADDVRRIFGDGLANVLPSASREVLRAGPDGSALRSAALRLVDGFRFLRR